MLARYLQSDRSLLDVRLAHLAKSHKCTYSRYVDDITFSTSRKEFPPEIAVAVPETSSRWKLGAPLVEKIEGSGFRINDNKTRMQCRGSRQVTTGLLVNEKVNVRPEYYRTVRAMCHQLFSTGVYFRILPSIPTGNVPQGQSVKECITELGPLEGALAHIYCVKHHASLRKNDDEKKQKKYGKKKSSNNDKEKPIIAINALYQKFLWYKNFVALKAPLIVTEGKTDSVYLKKAIKVLTKYQPRLGTLSDVGFSFSIRFMKFTRTIHELLCLGNGTGDFINFFRDYKYIAQKFGNKPLAHPVIFLVDNDDGATGLFSFLKNDKIVISHESEKAFY